MFTDPWADLDTGRQQRDNWMLSYIDMLTLLLTLFVILLVLQPKHELTETEGLRESADLASIQTIEGKPPAPVPSHETTQSVSLVEPAGSGTELALPLRLRKEKETAKEFFEPEFSITALTVEPFTPLKPLTAAKPDLGAVTKTETQEPGAIQKEKEISVSRSSMEQAKPSETTELDAVMANITKQKLDKRLKVSQKAKGIHLEVRDNVLFAEASAELKPEGLRLLADLAEILLQHRGIISVEGHTDNKSISSKRFPSNWELSSARATTVTRDLISHGLDSKKLRAVGYADTRPLESNSTSKGRSRNRRVSLILESPRTPPLTEVTSR